jgi:hypothetical protein
MAREIKYGQVTAEHGTIPDDELVFLLRAQDIAAVPTLKDYLAHCEDYGSPEGHLVAVEDVIREFERWQAHNAVKAAGAPKAAL